MKVDTSDKSGSGRRSEVNLIKSRSRRYRSPRRRPPGARFSQATLDYKGWIKENHARRTEKLREAKCSPTLQAGYVLDLRSTTHTYILHHRLRSTTYKADDSDGSKENHEKITATIR
ncbi:hypothetical protein Bbelb_006230 [Branchiostoma belcheri]|nr:hypothetical protein Bbelb_006230 [Branchiostoma belcheri]